MCINTISLNLNISWTDIPAARAYLKKKRAENLFAAAVSPRVSVA